MNSWWFISYSIEGHIEGHIAVDTNGIIFNLEALCKYIVKDIPNKTHKQVIIRFFKELTKKEYEIITRKEDKDE